MVLWYLTINHPASSLIVLEFICYLSAVLMGKYDNIVHKIFQFYPFYIMWIVRTW